VGRPQLNAEQQKILAPLKDDRPNIEGAPAK
jgi:hypothetical protein